MLREVQAHRVHREPRGNLESGRSLVYASDFHFTKGWGKSQGTSKIEATGAYSEIYRLTADSHGTYIPSLAAFWEGPGYEATIYPALQVYIAGTVYYLRWN